MTLKSRKDAMAICGRSGIETLKSKLVKDGYFRSGLWVLPEYYEPPQFWNQKRPVPELPPYNPQPLIDVYPQTVNLGQVSETPPYGVFSLGHFIFQHHFTITGAECDLTAGALAFQHEFLMVGIEVECETKIYSEDPAEGYGGNTYGSELYGGYHDAGPDFIVSFENFFGAASLTAAGTFTNGIGWIGYGDDAYSDEGYGGIT
jgi:hypothetical protein